MSKGAADTAASTELGPGSYFTTPDDSQLADAGNGALSKERPTGGIFGGFWKQYGDVLVGVEASANSLSIDDSRSQTVTYISAPPAQFNLRQSVKADWQGTLRLRLGYAQENWLAYLTGGAAVTRVKLDSSFSDNYVQAAIAQGSDTETKFGWTVGAGGEYALNERWSIRAEYLYVDFGRVESRSVLTNPAFPGLSNILTNSADLKTHTLTIGLAYRFIGL
ncbi:MAG: outer membrane protein [Betaproteobacteria bacterium]